MFVIGGRSEGEVLCSVEIYSSETNQFTYVTPVCQARFDLGCCILSNKVFVLGERKTYSNEAIDSVEVYGIENGVWSKGPNLPHTIAAFGCTSNSLF